MESELNSIKGTCLCGKKFFAPKWSLQKFCSKSCSNKFTKTGITLSENGKKNMRLAALESYKKGRIVWNKGLTKETDERVKQYVISGTKTKKGVKIPNKRKEKIRKTMLKNPPFKGHYHSEESKEKLRYATIKQLSEGKMPSKETKIERLIENQLLFREILYVKQYPYKLGVADFWLPEDNIIIHCDGDYWHSKPKTIERDKKQDEYLESEGVVVYRFSGYEIKNNAKNCVKKVLRNV